MSVEVLRKTSIKSDISIVIPIRNLEGWRVENALSSIRQNIETEVILSDFGSDEAYNQELEWLSDKYDVTHLYVKNVGAWSRGRANNIGIGRASGKIIIVIDGDIIIEKDVIRDTVEIIRSNVFVIRQPSFLSKSFRQGKIGFPDEYPLLKKEPESYVYPSFGAFIAAPRGAWFNLRGYDERLSIWGSDDWEIRQRLITTRLREVIIGRGDRFDGESGIIPPKRDCVIYHQWHISPSERLGVSGEVFEAQWFKNHGYFEEWGYIRNDDGWGMNGY